MPGVIHWLIAQLAAFQAALLLMSALHKFIRRERAQAAVREFAGVPRHFVSGAVALVAAAEAMAGLMLCTPAYRSAGGALAALIWGSYLLLILRAIAQGRRGVDCGCSFGASRRPLGTYQVLRNAALTAMGVTITVFSATMDGGTNFGAQTALAACALLSLYAALDQVMILMPPRAGESP
jgi:hypothetical protein